MSPFPGLLPPSQSELIIPQTDLWAWWKTPIGSYADNDQIDTWPDSSGNARDTIRATLAGSPNSAAGMPFFDENQINGYGAARFSAGSAKGAFLLPDMSSLTAATIYLMVKADLTKSAGGNSIGEVGTTSLTSEYAWSDTHIYNGFFTTVRKDEGTGLDTGIDAWHLFAVKSASGIFVDYLNGSVRFSTGTNTFGAKTQPIIGGGLDAVLVTTHFNGWIAEMAVYEVAQDDTARGAVEDYFTAKFGVP